MKPTTATAAGGQRSWPAALLLLGFFALFFAPVLFGDAVLYPHDNAEQVGLAPGPGRATSRFGDLSTEYLPELQQHLQSGHAGWLATWNPHNGLGLPLMQYYGLGRAFLLGHALALVTQDPFRTWTMLCILALLAAAGFAFLFLRRQQVHPLACLAGALTISLAPLHAGWETFPQIDWGFGWTFAFLWGLARLIERRSFARWAWLVFTLHALLLCGYPQHILWCAWFAGAWSIAALLRDVATAGERLRLALLLVAAVLVALASVAPVYLDLLVDLQRSTRADAGLELAARSLPRLQSWRDVRVLLVQLHDMFWLGDPLSPSYPKTVSVQVSHCLTPLPAALATLALLRPRRRGLPLMLGFLLVVAAVTASPAIFGFAVEYLGLSLSLLTPVTAALMPLAVLVAFGADAVLVRGAEPRVVAVAVACVPAAVALLAIAPGDVPLVADRVLLGVAFSVAAALFAGTGWRWLLVLLLGCTLLVYGRAFVFMWPRAELQLGSPLVSRVHELTADGGRFAWIGPPPGATLAANQEELLGLRSVHYHTCFPSHELASWSARFAGPGAPGPDEATATYDRRFASIADVSRLSSEDLACCGLRLLLSAHPLDSELVEPAERVGPAWLARLRDPGPLQAELDRWEQRPDGAHVEAPELRRSPHVVVSRPTGRDDELLLQVEPLDHAALLFLSQEHHPAWRAWVDGVAARTVPVNGLFEGVELPPGAREVRLRFLPWVRWSWLPQLGFVALGLGWLLARARSWRSREA